MEDKVAAVFQPAEETLADAGLTLSDFAHLTPFSRSTLYNWRTGRKYPNPFYKATLDGWIALIRKAVDNDRLPMAVQLTGGERKQVIKRIITEVKRLP